MFMMSPAKRRYNYKCKISVFSLHVSDFDINKNMLNFKNQFFTDTEHTLAADHFKWKTGFKPSFNWSKVSDQDLEPSVWKHEK